MDKLLQVVTSEAISQRQFTQPLVKIPPLRECEICAIVPVRNEAETLRNTLEALAYQTDLHGRRFDPKRYEIIVLANNCSDDSTDLANNFAAQNPDLALHVVEITLPPNQAYIGRVRKMLMDEAYHRLHSLGRRRGVIASTDGDSQVSSNWIAANLYEINRGVDAVGGRIIIQSSHRSTLHPDAKACYLREVGYRYLIAELESYLNPNFYDPFPRHFQHYGASLAVTVEMYALAGGLPAVRTPEDEAFYRALLRVNARFRHSPLVKVVTSARVTGRSEVGLANQLKQWTKTGSQAFMVEPGEAVATRFRARHQLWVLWWCILKGYPSTQNIEELADTFGIDTQWLTQQLHQPQSFNTLFERIEQRSLQQGIWLARWGKVDIREAIPQLRKILQDLRNAKKRKVEYLC
jgi:hypothetical protein